MFKYIKLLVVIFSLFVMSNCAAPDTYLPDANSNNEVPIYLTVRTPQPSLPKNRMTRTVNEMLIEHINILVLEDDGTGTYRYQYAVRGLSLTNNGESYNFNARIISSQRPLRLYLVANSSQAIPNLNKDDSEETVKSTLSGVFTTNGFGTSLPMTEIIDLPEGLTTGRQLSGSLVRSAARADIINNVPENFSLNSIRVYRANNSYRIIPDFMTDHRVTSPSIPPNSLATLQTNPVYITGISSIGDIYLPESSATLENDRRLKATCIVVGGYYGDDTNETFYRLDFVPDNNPDIFGQILRNHRYSFNINSVSGSGWPDPDEASRSVSSQIDVQIKEWNENTTSSVFDDTNHFSVSTREVILGSSEGASEIIKVDTDVHTYTAYWLDDNGNIDNSVLPFTLGGKSTDPTGNYDVGISANGDEIKFTAKSDYDLHIPAKKVLIKASRLEIVLTVKQANWVYTKRNLKIYGSLSEIGRLIDQIFGFSTVRPDRSNGLVDLLTNSHRFGPGGTYDFEGFIIGGREGHSMTRNMAELFDIIYLTYAGNPTNPEMYLQWLEDDPRRVLVVQMDNSSTNRNLMELLNLQVITSSNTAPYKFSTDTPQKIQNGPFGQIDLSSPIRVFDTTHGETNLQSAINKGFVPILIGPDGGMSLGIDPVRRIVLNGDIDLGYKSSGSASSGFYMSGNGNVNNDADRLIGNLWSYIADISLMEQ